MKFKVQVVTLSDGGEEAVRDVGCVERDDLTAASLGLSIDAVLPTSVRESEFSIAYSHPYERNPTTGRRS